LERVCPYDGRRLRSLRTRLFTSAYVEGRPIGHMVHRLELTRFSEEDDVHEVTVDIHSILMLAPNLCGYSLSRWTTDQSDLLSLAHGSRASITHLDLLVNAASDDVFTIINTFRHLRVLLLELEDNGTWTHPISQALKHTLERVIWSSTSDDVRMLDFLAACSFGPKCRISISLPGVQSSIASRLDGLFSAHMFEELELAMSLECMEVLSSGIVRTHRLILTMDYPPFRVLNRSDLPAKITVMDDNYDFFCGDQIVLHDHLQTLATSDRRHEPPVMLTITSTWEWPGTDGLCAPAASDFLPLAAPLLKRGIVLGDKHGRDATWFEQI
jgi:hypothetical protein